MKEILNIFPVIFPISSVSTNGKELVTSIGVTAATASEHAIGTDATETQTKDGTMILGYILLMFFSKIQFKEFFHSLPIFKLKKKALKSFRRFFFKKEEIHFTRKYSGPASWHIVNQIIIILWF